MHYVLQACSLSAMCSELCNCIYQLLLRLRRCNLSTTQSKRRQIQHMLPASLRSYAQGVWLLRRRILDLLKHVVRPFAAAEGIWAAHISSLPAQSTLTA